MCVCCAAPLKEIYFTAPQDTDPANTYAFYVSGRASTGGATYRINDKDAAAAAAANEPHSSGNYYAVYTALLSVEYVTL